MLPINEAKEQLLRKNNVPVVTRKAVSSKETVVEISTLFGTELYVMTRKCTCCEQTQPINNYYIKRGYQDVPAEKLTPKHFRAQCIKCFDSETKNNRRIRSLKKKINGQMGEWLKPTDCKSVAYGYVGSNPALSTNLEDMFD